MINSLFATPSILLQGLLIGSLFGFLLQKGRVSRFDTIVGQFLFKDFTVLKIILTAIITGSITLYILKTASIVSESMLIPSSILGSAFGGLIFGIGMATLGYCPGTAVAALAEGARDVIFGLAGMVFGAALFERAYPYLYNLILSKDQTKETLNGFLGISEPLFILILVIFALILFYALKSLEKKSKKPS